LVKRVRSFLEYIGVVVIQIELGVMNQIDAVGPVSQYRRNAVEGVRKTIDTTQLVTVIGRDRHLDNPFPLGDELNNDLGVKVEIVRVVTKWQLGKRGRPIGTISGVDVPGLRPV